MGKSDPSGLSALRLLRKIIFWGLILNIGYCVFAKHFISPSYPNNTFLFRPVDRFSDLPPVLRATYDLDPYKYRVRGNIPEVSNYFPFTHIVLYPLTFLNEEVAIGVFLLGSLLALSFGFLRICRFLHMHKKAEIFWTWLIVVVLDFPVLFAFDRANLEVWLFPAVAFGIYLISIRRLHPGAIVIGLAGAVKAFPLIFLYPLFKDRKFGAISSGVLAAALSTFVSLMLFEGGLTYQLTNMRAAFGGLGNFLLSGINGIVASLNIFSLIYSAYLVFNPAFLPMELLTIFKFYYDVSIIIILAATLAFIFFARIEKWKQWGLLVIAIQLLPLPSFDYRLLYSFVPLTFLILNMSSPLTAKRYIWMYGLLIIPKAPVLFLDLRVGCIVNPILLLITGLMIVFDKTCEEEPPPAPALA